MSNLTAESTLSYAGDDGDLVVAMTFDGDAIWPNRYGVTITHGGVTMTITGWDAMRLIDSLSILKQAIG